MVLSNLQVGKGLKWVHSSKTKIAPGNGRLEDYFHFVPRAILRGDVLSFRQGIFQLFFLVAPLCVEHDLHIGFKSPQAVGFSLCEVVVVDPEEI